MSDNRPLRGAATKSAFVAAALALLAANAAAQDTKEARGLFGQMPEKADPQQSQYLTGEAGQVLVSNLIGQDVYNGTGGDAAAIGKVTDILVGADGPLAAIIGVGGFLGIGDKEVAIGIGELSWAGEGDQARLVVAAGKEELQAAPAFDRSALTKTEPLAGASPAAPAAEPEPADRSALKAVPSAAVSADRLIGAAVFGPEDESLGNVNDALMMPDGQVEALVVDVGGFLGIGKKPIAISIENLDLLADEAGKVSVFTPFTKQELEAHPAYSAEAYNADRDRILLRGTAE